jgi:hypothetical protein
VSGSGAVTDLLGKTGTNIAANTAKQVVGGGGKVDPVQALLGNVLDTGVNSLSTVLPDVGGFIPEDLKGVANTVAKAAISGKPIDQAVAGYLTRQALNSSGSPSTKSSADLQAEDPLTPEEQAQLAENRLSKVIRQSQISPEEEDANTQNTISELERLYAPDSTTTSPPSTSSLSDNTRVEEADDFLKSIGINTLDKAKDSGLSNKDIEDMISGGNELIITGNRDTVGRGVSNDILRNLEDAGVDPNELIITANRDKADKTQEHVFDPTFGGTKPITNTDLDELIIATNRDKTQEHVFDPTFGGTKPITDTGLDELIITGNRDKTQEHVFDPTFGGTKPITDTGLDELVITTNRDKTQEHVFDPTFGGTEPLPVTSTTPTTPVVKPGTPAVKPGTPAVKPTTQTQTNPLDLMSLFTMLSPGQQAPQMPRQKNSAEIELMKDIFGSTLNFD